MGGPGAERSSRAPARWFDAIVGPALGALAVALFLLERRWPLRRPTQPPGERLRTNAGVAALAAVVMRTVLLPAVVGVARWAERHEVGVVRTARLPPFARGAAAFLLMDYTTFLWHRANHVVPFLWRFHSVHHTDLDLDVSTAFRFHAGELLLSVGARSLQVTGIGLGPALTLVWEAAELAAAAFHHSNVRLPLAVEQALVRLVVTPRMHGIHHSIVERETNANWSVVFSWWDRAHRTLRLNVPQASIVVGLPAYRAPHELGIAALLAMPFRTQRPVWRLPSGEQPERCIPGDPRRLAA